jgi:hypothetical protein
MENTRGAFSEEERALFSLKISALFKLRFSHFDGSGQLTAVKSAAGNSSIAN